MLYLKIANSAVIIVSTIFLSTISAMIGHPWEQILVLEAFYLIFCFFRNIAIFLVLTRIKIILLFAAIYSVFVSINLFLSIILGQTKFIRDVWNEEIITLQSAFVNTLIWVILMYILWIILTVLKEDKYINSRGL